MTKLNFLTACCCLIVTTLFSQKSEFSTLLIPSELKEDANAVVRIDNQVVDIKSQDVMVIKTEVAITILNKLAEHYSDIQLFYDRERKIVSFSGRVYDAMGNQIEKIKKSDFDDYSASDGFSLYNDGRFLNYDYTPTTYPYTIHYTYEVKTSNTAFIPRWMYLTSYYKSIEESIFTLNYPLNFKLYKSENNFEGFNIVKVENPGQIKYITKNIPVIEYEPNAPSIRKVVPTAKFAINNFHLEGVNGKAENWQEFGKWYYDNLIRETLYLSDPAKSKIKALTSSTDDPEEKAKIVYEYVQDKVRYISVQIGIGGFKPMNAGDVDKLSYGDCKALTNYTASLLDEVGVDAYHALVYADRKRDIDSLVASPEGNHMILYVPIGEKDIWLECTSQDMPFAEIGDFTDDRDVLVITPQGGEIKHTKVYDPRDSQQAIKGNYSIEPNGNIEAEVSVVYRGTQFDNHLGIETSNNKDKEKLYKEFWDNINNITLNNIDVKNNKKEGQFEENISFTATNYGTVSGNRMIIPLNAFNVIGRAPKRVRNRKLPVDIPRGFYDTDEVTIKLPSDYTIEAIADDVNVDTKYGTYTMTVEKIDEYNLKFTRKFLLNAGEYPKEEYEDYRNFWRKVVKGDKSKIVLVKK
ncbi:MAG: DUF3857 domain-containing protein [Urechidicola sp.]|nr:DUF3857 domain-containing protein [Urechidicola sp.]